MQLQTSKVSYLTITASAGEGQRIDNFLVKKLYNVPKSKIYNILRKGEVRVNKGRIKPTYKLQLDDVIRIPPLTQSFKPEKTISIDSVSRFAIENAVLYQDENLLVINKPAGLAVHGGSGLNFGLIELVRKTYNEESLELIHRIDKETSGCLMLARNPGMLRAMHALFRDKKITKKYNLLVKGFAPSRFMVQQPLLKNILRSGERMVTVHPEGQDAVTKFNSLQHFKGVTLLEAKPITGRTHQIRVHSLSKGLPIIGDQKYGDKVYNKIFAQKNFKRLFLHAKELSFTCPITGKDIHIDAKFDATWNEALIYLNKECTNAR